MLRYKHNMSISKTQFRAEIWIIHKLEQRPADKTGYK